jgi:hypothetical protein
MTDIKEAQVLKVDNNNNQATVQTFNLSSQPVDEYEYIYSKIWPDETESTHQDKKMPIYLIAVIIIISLLVLLSSIIIICVCKRRGKVSAKYSTLENPDDDNKKAKKAAIKGGVKKNTIKTNTNTNTNTTSTNNPILNSYLPVSIQTTENDDI